MRTADLGRHPGLRSFRANPRELIDKMGKRRPHVGVAKIAHWLQLVLHDRVNSEAAIDAAPADNQSTNQSPM
jgi:hypothetical protein